MYFWSLKFFGLAILLFLSNLCLSQTKLNDLFPNIDFLKSKKNQIEKLNFKIDSLNEVLIKEREFNTKTVQSTKTNIDKLEAEIATTKQSLVLCQFNLDSLNEKIQILSNTDYKKRHNIEENTPLFLRRRGSIYQYSTKTGHLQIYFHMSILKTTKSLIYLI